MRGALNNLLDIYLKSSIHVALAVVAFTGVTIFSFDIERNWELLLFTFFGTVTGYNFIKYSTVAKFHHRSLTGNLRIIQIFSLLCFIGLIYFALRQPLSVLIASAVFGLLMVLYALPVFANNKNLRSISGIKIFIIAFVWAGVTVALPVLTSDGIYLIPFIIEFIQRCLFVMVLTLPFDIRDLNFDQEHLGTIPQLYGKEKTSKVGTVLLSAVLFLEVIKPVVEARETVVLLIIIVITYFLIRKSIRQQSKYFASFWVEGVPILWWGLLYLFNKI